MGMGEAALGLESPPWLSRCLKAAACTLHLPEDNMSKFISHQELSQTSLGMYIDVQLMSLVIPASSLIRHLCSFLFAIFFTEIDNLFVDLPGDVLAAPASAL